MPLALPRFFAANRGQARPAVQFVSAGGDATVLLTDHGIGWRLRAGSGRSQEQGLALSPLHVRKKLLWKADDVLAAQANYFRGNDPRRWHTGVPLSTRARAKQVLPGVDWVVYARGGSVEYDLVVSPGSPVSRIRFRVDTLDRLQVDAAGDILVGALARASTGASAGDDPASSSSPVIRMHRPVAYQEIRGERVEVDAAYRLARDGTLGFTVGAHDPLLPLVIDPYISITYDSFLGINAEFSTGNSLALDASGNLYIGGTAQTGTVAYGGAPNVPTNPFGPLGGDTDITITKINPNLAGAMSVIYISYIGGTGNDQCGGIVVDSSGSATIVGSTTSLDFPTASNATQTVLTGTQNLVISKLDPTGTILQYSTYFGGTGEEDSQSAMGIVLDAAGNWYVTSDSSSTDLPVTAGAFNAVNGGGASDGFLVVYTRTDATHYAVTYCTYFGANATVGSAAIAVDAATPPHVYLGGFTSAAATPFTTGGFQTAYGGGSFDGFVMVFTPEGLGALDLAYSTLLGGSSEDQILALAIDSASPPNIYVTGTTQSTDFPVNAALAAYQGTLAQATVGDSTDTTDAFAARIAQNAGAPGMGLAYSTYLGTGADSGMGIAAASANAVYVVGHTALAWFPAVQAMQTFAGTSDAWLAKFDMTQGSTASLVYSTPLGGANDSQANAVATDGNGDIFIVGSTTSGDFPDAGHASTGFEVNCLACATNSPTSDGFVSEITEMATPAPIARVTAAQLSFGNQANGATNVPPQPVAIYNVGAASLTAPVLEIAGPNASDFPVLYAASCSAGLFPGATCSFEVGFTPTTGAAESAELDITDNASPGTQVVQLTGSGVGASNGPALTITPLNLNFGSVVVGTPGNVQFITIANTGNAPVTLAIPNLTGANTADFQFGNPSPCLLMAQLEPTTSCSLYFKFVPGAVGNLSASLKLPDGPDGSVQTVSLTGIAVAAAPVAGLEPTSLTFGAQPVATSSGIQSILVNNTGSAALQFYSITLGGPNGSEFQIAPAQTTCVAGGPALAPAGPSCAISVIFSPASLGAKVAALMISDNASPSTQQVVLSGTALGPTAVLSVNSLTFGVQNVGSSSTPQPITLSNTGNGSLTINSISISGTASAAFSQNNTCGAVLYQNAQCTINVTYQPTAAGSQFATLTIADNAVSSPQSAQLAGTGQVSLLTLLPAALTFSSQLVETLSTPLVATVTNTSAAAVSGLQLTVGGANAGDFQASNNCGTGLAAGASCALNVTFQPVASGTRTGILNLSYLGTGSPATAVLTGVSSDYSINAANTSAGSASVTAAQTATYGLLVAPLNGFTGNVSITCSGAPAEATCAVPATALDVTTSAVPFSVTVTTQAGSLASSRGAPGWREEVPWGWPLRPIWLVCITLVVAIPILCLGRRWAWLWPWRNLRVATASLAALVVLVALVSLAGCIGSSTSTPTPTPTVGTPAGTYTLTITGTTQGTSRTLNLTLTVDASN
jgi:hypothetical protein